jgi:DNA-binding NarL/FixJ family response regulator
VIRVLIADDHGVIRDGLSRLLDAADGIEVAGLASDGEQVVALASELTPDVVLMDLDMPGTDGIEATQRIVSGGGAAAVLVLTSFSDQPRILGAIEAGAVGYLLKDASSEDVVEGIRAAARGESPLDPRAARTVLNARAAPDPLAPFSPREREVLELLARGLSNPEICERLVISEATTKTHVARVLQKLGVRDRIQAVIYAYETGLVEPGRGD